MLGIGQYITRFFSSLHQLSCIAVTIDEQGEYGYSFLHFERDTNEFVKTDDLFQTRDLQVLLSKVPSKHPIALFIDGKGIITRFLPGVFHSKQDVLTHFADFANDSFIQEVSIIEEGAVVSFARKQIVEEISQLFVQQNHRIIKLSLGAGVYSSVLQFVEDKSDIEAIPGWNFTYTQKQLKGIEKKSIKTSITSVRLGGEKIQNIELYAYFLAIDCFQLSFLKRSTNNFFESHKKDFYYSLISKQLAIVSMALLLVVLVINTLVFNAHYTQEQTLSFQVTQHNTILRDLQQMQQEYEQKKALFSHVNIYKSSGFPYFFDRIAATLPGEIVLQKMSCNPLQKDIKQDKEILFNSNTIIVHGTTRQITSVYQWIELLKKESWVQDVQLVDYSNTVKESGALFIVKIKI